MITFKSTDDYPQMPVDIVKHLNDALDGEPGNFLELLGGDVHLITDVEDLARIPVGDGNATNTIAPLDSVDDVGEHVLFFTATNNAGGESHFVPKLIYNKSLLLKLIKSATDEHWRKYTQ